MPECRPSPSKASKASRPMPGRAWCSRRHAAGDGRASSARPCRRALDSTPVKARFQALAPRGAARHAAADERPTPRRARALGQVDQERRRQTGLRQLVVFALLASRQVGVVTRATLRLVPAAHARAPLPARLCGARHAAEGPAPAGRRRALRRRARRGGRNARRLVVPANSIRRTCSRRATRFSEPKNIKSGQPPPLRVPADAPPRAPFE